MRVDKMKMPFIGYDSRIDRIVVDCWSSNNQMQIEDLKKKISDFQKQDYEKEQVDQKIFDYQCQQLMECCCDYMRRSKSTPVGESA